jgi:hypothetical protein
MWPREKIALRTPPGGERRCAAARRALAGSMIQRAQENGFTFSAGVGYTARSGDVPGAREMHSAIG